MHQTWHSQLFRTQKRIWKLFFWKDNDNLQWACLPSMEQLKQAPNSIATVNLPPTDLPCSVQMMLLLWFTLLSNPITLYQVIRELTIRQMRRMPATDKNDRAHGYVAGGCNVFVVQFRKARTKNGFLMVVSHGYHNNHNKIISLMTFGWI